MKAFLKNNYDRHLIYGYIIAIFLNWFFPLFLDWDLRNIEKALVLGIAVGVLAFARELYYMHFKGAPFDIKDIAWSALGGLVIILNLI